MTKREVASLTIRLMGVWVLIKTLSFLPMSILNIVSLKQTAGPALVTAMLWNIGLAAAAVIWAAAIILFSNRFAVWLTKDNKTLELKGPIEKHDVLTVAFACIGLFLIVSAIPTILNSAAMYFLLRKVEAGYGYQSASTHYIASVFSAIVQIALGVWLFAGARGIAAFGERIRGFGLKQV